MSRLQFTVVIFSQWPLSTTNTHKNATFNTCSNGLDVHLGEGVGSCLEMVLALARGDLMALDGEV